MPSNPNSREEDVLEAYLKEERDESLRSTKMLGGITAVALVVVAAFFVSCGSGVIFWIRELL